MIMITGGAFSGKLDFARERFGLKEEEIICGADCSLEDVLSARCVEHYELVIRRLLDGGTKSPKPDPLDFTDRMIRENPDVIVIMDEIGSGIIPLEKSERHWRELTGRAGCQIAQRADAVIRICCGIPATIKGTL